MPALNGKKKSGSRQKSKTMNPGIGLFPGQGRPGPDIFIVHHVHRMSVRRNIDDESADRA
jgi:hypothetical protein